MATNGNVRETTSAMRILLMVASALVFIIGIPLFLLPSDTDEFFSWMINPPLTAAFLGAAYWASFLLEYRCAKERVWARARLAVPAVLLFTTLTLVVTLMHVDKFHFDADVGSITWGITWTWLVVYAVVPIIMTVVLIVQSRRPGNDPVRIAPPQPWLRWALAAQAAVMLIFGVALLIAPTSVAPNTWPWVLSALTGRAIGAWLIGLGTAAAHAAFENDLVRFEGPMIAYIAFGALQLGALLRFAAADHPVTGDPVLDWGDVRTWIYAAFLLSIAVVGVVGWLGARNAKRAAD